MITLSGRILSRENELGHARHLLAEWSTVADELQSTRRSSSQSWNQPRGAEVVRVAFAERMSELASLRADLDAERRRNRTLEELITALKAGGAQAAEVTGS